MSRPFLKLTGTNVILHYNQPSKYINEPDGPVFRELDRRMTRAQFGARRMVRVRTGKLLSSIRKNRGYARDKPYVEVIAGGRGVRYARFENDGTRPHIIKARRKKSLRFVQNGQIRFAQQVHHPGTRGSHFLDRALPLAGD